MEIYTKQNIINYTSDPDEANDFKYDRKLQIARKALREDDMEAKRTGGTVDWGYCSAALILSNFLKHA